MTTVVVHCGICGHLRLERYLLFWYDDQASTTVPGGLMQLLDPVRRSASACSKACAVKFRDHAPGRGYVTTWEREQRLRRELIARLAKDRTATRPLRAA